ncbi:hypothetical protein DFP73DRAFT_543167 [Morchella snyderi]|nr:hypothetical protein DFP73DRAFT_543167 [Morchella snyderi]
MTTILSARLVMFFFCLFVSFLCRGIKPVEAFPIPDTSRQKLPFHVTRYIPSRHATYFVAEEEWVGYPARWLVIDAPGRDS